MEGNIIFSILLVLIGIFVGIIIMFILNYIRGNLVGKKAEILLEKAKKDGEKAKRDFLLEAKEEAHRLKNDIEKELKEKKEEVKEAEERLLARESNLEKRDQTLQNKESMLEEKENNLINKQRTIQEEQSKVEEIKKEQIEQLEKISGLSKKEAKSIVDRIKDKSIGTKGFLIYSQDGSVGAGRKYTAQAIAGESKIPYVEINAVDFGTKDVDLFGGGNLSPEASMKKLFGMVKAQAETNPKKAAILYIENFEYFSYGEYLSEYHEKAMSQLIREMNKAQEQGMNIVVMGSMNNPEYIGAATSKSFKFIDQIEVESPI